MAWKYGCTNQNLSEMIIRKVRDPSNFWGVKAKDSESGAFNELQMDIHNYFSNELIFKAILPNPSPGMQCVVRTGTSEWERGHVEAVMVTHNGYKVKCFLVDRITTDLFPANRIYVSPDWVWTVPPRGIRLALYGVMPISLKPNYFQDNVERKTTNGKWDVAATEYFRNLINENRGEVYVKVIKKLADGSHLIRLYAPNKLDNETYNVNEILVRRQFACKGSTQRVMTLQTNDSSSSNKESMMEEEESSGSDDEESSQAAEDSTRQQHADFQQRSSAMLKKQMEEYNEILKCAQQDDKEDSDMSIHSEACGSSSDASESSVGARKRSTSKRSPNFNMRSASSSPSQTSDDNDCSLLSEKRQALKVSRNSCKLDVENDHKRSPPPMRSQYRSPETVKKSSVILPNFHNMHTAKFSAAGRGKGFIDSLKQHLANSTKESKASQASDQTSPQRLRDVDEKVSLDCIALSPNRKNCIRSQFPNNLAGDSSLEPSQTQFEDGDLEEKLSQISIAEKNSLSRAQLKQEAKKLDNLPGFGDSLPTGIGRGMSIMSRRQPSEESSAPLSGSSGSVVERKKSSVEKSKKKVDASLNDQAFFLAKTAVLDSSQNSGAMLVKGVEPPNPIPLFCDAPFPSHIIDTMQNMKYRGPYFLQAHVWSAILSRRNLLALAPSGGGKTLAYVVPILAMLNPRKDLLADGRAVSIVKKTRLTSRSPQVIVLCSSWRNVETVVDCFKHFLKNPHQDRAQQCLRVVGICGGPKNEEANLIELITGCDILVCSPYTLIRILRENYIDLKRLEQLVLDDFHILVEEFTLKIRETMTLWGETLDDPDRSPDPSFKPQILCFGIQWTSGVESFMKVFLKKPLLYISDPLEASVYGEVVHHVDVLTQPSMFDCLVGLLKNSPDRQGGVAVFVNSVEKMKEVLEALKSISIYCIEAHRGMSDYELQIIQQSYDEPPTTPVLVVCDNVLSVIEIDNIEVGIHYEFPKDDYTLGMRLSLMKHFFKIQKTDSKEGTAPHSHILLNEKELPTSLWLDKFLSRLSQPSTSHYRQVAKRTMENLEVGKSNYTLCPFLKAYGKCRDERSCSFRHWIAKNLDKPNLDRKYPPIPITGHVKIRVTKVKNASLFFGHLLKHRPSIGQPVHTYPNTYQQLCQDLNNYYSSEEHRHSPDFELEVDQLFAIKLSNQFHRAKTIYTPVFKFRKDMSVCWTTKGGVTKARILFVDTGAVHSVNINELLLLPKRLQSIPYQAIEVRTTNCRPIDQDTEWLFAANKLVHEMTFEKEIEGNIQLALGHTMWLQPVLIRSKLPLTGYHVDDCNVVQELLASGLAEKNPSQLDKLLSDCHGKDILPESADTTPTVSPNRSNGEKHSSARTSISPKRPNNDSLPKMLTSPNKGTTTALNHCQDLEKTPTNRNMALCKRQPSTPEDNDITSPSKLSCSSDSDITVLDEAIQCVGPVISRGSVTHESSPYPDLPPLIVDTSDDDNDERIPQTTTRTCNTSLMEATSCSKISFTPLQPCKLPASKTKPTKPCWYSPGYLSTSEESSALKPKQPISKYSNDSFVSSEESNKSSAPVTSHSRNKVNIPSTPLSALPCSEKIEPKAEKFPPLHPDNVRKVGHDTTYKKVTDYLENQKSISFHQSPGVSRDIEDRDLPPQEDMYNNSLLYPCYVKLCYYDDIRQRISVCEEIYVTCSESSHMVTERDLSSVYKALLSSKNQREATLLTGALLVLASHKLPVQDFVSLSVMVKRFCTGVDSKSLELAQYTLAVCMVLLDETMQKDNQDSYDLAESLISFLNEVTLNFHIPQDSAIPLLKSCLLLLEKLMSSPRHLLSKAQHASLMDVLSRVKSDKDTDEIRKRLFTELMICMEDDEKKDEDSFSSISTKHSTKAKTANKKYDRLDYDRFNNIDTTDTSDSGSSYRPYTPVHCKFDSTSETQASETDTDTDFLPGT